MEYKANAFNQIYMDESKPTTFLLVSECFICDWVQLKIQRHGNIKLDSHVSCNKSCISSTEIPSKSTQVMQIQEKI